MESDTSIATPRRKTGRPLSFDRDAALEKAMLVFWRHGYETSSITDLTGAMGITAPSLYTAFGDKKQLFLEAVRRYAGDPEASRIAIESAPTAHDAARTLLFGAAAAYTGNETPPGCLLASATASGSAAVAGRAGGDHHHPGRHRRDPPSSDQARHRRGRIAGTNGRRGAGRVCDDGPARLIGHGPRRPIPTVANGHCRDGLAGLAGRISVGLSCRSES